jgi:hypothetical protein
MRKQAWRVAVLLCIALVAPHAGAQTVEQQAEARARYERALVLMREHSFEQACELFDESLALSADMTTAFRLAECYQQLGKLGLAWRYYAEVTEAAAAAGMDERRDFAGFRASALADRLARLKVNVRSDMLGLAGLTIELDGRPLAPALWNEELRVEPGGHELSATALGFEKWTAEVNLPSIHDGAEVTVVLRPAKPPSDLHLPPTGVGIALTVIGAAAVVSGIVVGGVAKSNYDDSLAQCVGDSCSEAALNEQQEAVTLGDTGTVVFSIGAAMAVTGITLWLLSAFLGDESEGDTGATPNGVVVRF